MLKVKKLVAIVLTVAMLSTLCVFADAAETTTKTITLLDKNFNDQDVSEIGLENYPAAFYVENGTATTPQISEGDYGLTSDYNDTWFICMGMNKLLSTGKVTVKYSFDKANSWKTSLWVKPAVTATNKYKDLSGGKIVGSVGDETANGTTGTHMCGFNDSMTYSANDAYKSGGGTPQALVDGMNDVRLEIDYDEDYIKLFLNDNSTPVITEQVSKTPLSAGVGGFMIVGKVGSIFDDISIKWEYPTKVVYYDNNFDAGPTTAATAQYTGVKFGWENAADYRTTATYGSATGVNAGSYSDIWYAMLTLPELVNTGVLTYSFDFVKEEGETPTWVRFANAVPGNTTTSSFTTATMSDAIAMNRTYMFGPEDNFKEYGDSNVKKDVTDGKIHTIKQVVDYDAGKVYTYVDDVILTEKSITSANAIGGVQFAFASDITFFDNFKVEWEKNLIKEVKILKDSTEITKADINAGDELTLKITVNRFLADDAAVLLSGLYISDVMVDGGTADVVWSYDEGTAQVNLTVPQSYTGELELKGFLWNSLSKLKPLTKSF